MNYELFSSGLHLVPRVSLMSLPRPCRRTVRNLARDRMGVLMRLSQNLIYGLFVAFFVMKLDTNIKKGAVQDRIGVIYQSMGASPYTGMLNAVALCKSSEGVSGDQPSEDQWEPPSITTPT